MADRGTFRIPLDAEMLTPPGPGVLAPAAAPLSRASPSRGTEALRRAALPEIEDALDRAPAAHLLDLGYRFVEER